MSIETGYISFRFGRMIDLVSPSDEADSVRLTYTSARRLVREGIQEADQLDEKLCSRLTAGMKAAGLAESMGFRILPQKRIEECKSTVNWNNITLSTSGQTEPNLSSLDLNDLLVKIDNQLILARPTMTFAPVFEKDQSVPFRELRHGERKYFAKVWWRFLALNTKRFGVDIERDGSADKERTSLPMKLQDIFLDELTKIYLEFIHSKCELQVDAVLEHSLIISSFESDDKSFRDFFKNVAIELRPESKIRFSEDIRQGFSALAGAVYGEDLDGYNLATLSKRISKTKGDLNPDLNEGESLDTETLVLDDPYGNKAIFLVNSGGGRTELVGVSSSFNRHMCEKQSEKDCSAEDSKMRPSKTPANVATAIAAGDIAFAI